MRMNKAFCVVALALLVGVGSVTRAEAIPVISLEGITPTNTAPSSKPKATLTS